ncbi:MAG: hypothetical protein D6767_06600, partial [Candidatus Hydrogenedentota bacterium]
LYASPVFMYTEKYTNPILSFTYIYDWEMWRYSFFLSRSARFEESQIVNDITKGGIKIFYFTPMGVLGSRLSLFHGLHLDRTEQIAFGGTFVRGYPYLFNRGDIAYLSTLEYRTPPVQVWVLALGGVLFFDAGQTLNKGDNLSPLASVGFGLRGNIARFDDTLFRLDVGFPLQKSPNGVLNQVSFGLQQVF